VWERGTDWGCAGVRGEGERKEGGGSSSKSKYPLSFPFPLVLTIPEVFDDTFGRVDQALSDPLVGESDLFVGLSKLVNVVEGFDRGGP
jgi:hypothetical protein